MMDAGRKHLNRMDPTPVKVYVYLMSRSASLFQDLKEVVVGSVQLPFYYSSLTGFIVGKSGQQCQYRRT